jgi:hypothetical protein
MLPMFVGWKCFPSRKGLVSGLIYASNGAGANISSLVSLQIVNPENVSPSIKGTQGSLVIYYFDQAISSNVPILYRYLVLGELAILVLALSVIYIPEEEH